jgi:DNA-binding transcriptional MerR regulator
MSGMDETEALVSIGTFARRVGLTPSALRFYDDCGVLRPAQVDGVTGYRYYAPDQEPRAVLVRRLREAGLPLVEASVVLDGDRDEAREVLAAHARRTRDTAAASQAVIDDLLRDLSGGAETHVGGAELFSAVRQVAPSAARGAVRKEFPVLGCVLIELTDQELRLVATDRYRLAVRVVRPRVVSGGPRHLLVDVDTMKDIASWAVRLPEVGIEIDDRGARVHGGDERRPLRPVDGTFPDYRILLENLPAAPHRLIVDREALRTVLTDHQSGPVTLRTGERDRLVVRHGTAETEVPSINIGPPLRVAFDPAVLLPAVEASVGPDVLLEISSGTRPVVVRSADQGSFTTLVMPVLDTTPPENP